MPQKIEYYLTPTDGSEVSEWWVVDISYEYF